MTEKEKAAKLKKQQKLQDKKKLALEEKNAKLAKKKAKQDKKNAKLQKEKDKKQAKLQKEQDKKNKERDKLLKLKEEEKANLEKLEVKEKVKQQKLEEKAKLKQAKLEAKQKEKDKKQDKKNKEKNAKNNNDLSDEELKKQRIDNRNSQQTFNALDDDDDDDDDNTEKKPKKDRSSIIVTIILGLIASISLLNVLSNTIQERNSDGYFKIDEVLTTVGSDKNYMKIGIALGGVNKDINKLDAGTVEVALTNALQDINFDAVLGIGGYEYLKEFLLQKLREDFGEQIESVNIHSLFTQVIG